MGLYRVINMGVPALIGVCQQASGGGGGGKSLTISTITITTAAYGTTTLAGLTPIDPSQQITTVLNSSNSFTVPTKLDSFSLVIMLFKNSLLIIL